MDEQLLRREVGDRATTRLRVALVVCASISAVSLGMSLAAFDAVGKMAAAPPAAPRDACGAPVTLRATVSRATAAASLGGAAGCPRSARIVPAIQSGRPHGVKVYAIRDGSLPSMIGLRNGDTVLRVQGTGLTTPQAILDAASRVRGAGPLTLDIERHGCPMSIIVDVQ